MKRIKTALHQCHSQVVSTLRFLCMGTQLQVEQNRVSVLMLVIWAVMPSGLVGTY
jgi:hypothetical protein